MPKFVGILLTLSEGGQEWSLYYAFGTLKILIHRKSLELPLQDKNKVLRWKSQDRKLLWLLLESLNFIQFSFAEQKNP